jgi:hypothetical protein
MDIFHQKKEFIATSLIFRALATTKLKTTRISQNYKNIKILEICEICGDLFFYSGCKCKFRALFHPG